MHTAYTVRRDRYNAIYTLPQPVVDLLQQVQRTAGWETGIKSIRRGYEARSIDVYGYDVSRQLAVVQIRRVWKSRQYAEINKIYALVGIDEEQVFSHPLPFSPRRNPHLYKMDPADVVRWAESKIFGVPIETLDKIIRQGDIALVPVRSVPKDAVPVQGSTEEKVRTVCLRESHLVQVDGVLSKDVRNNIWYAEGLVEIVHTKDEHKSISGEGRFKIVLGQRAKDPWWINTAIGD